jgi:hypothetical protein
LTTGCSASRGTATERDHTQWRWLVTTAKLCGGNEDRWGSPAALTASPCPVLTGHGRVGREGVAIHDRA